MKVNARGIPETWFVELNNCCFLSITVSCLEVSRFIDTKSILCAIKTICAARRYEYLECFSLGPIPILKGTRENCYSFSNGNQMEEKNLLKLLTVHQHIHKRWAREQQLEAREIVPNSLLWGLCFQISNLELEIHQQKVALKSRA